MEKRTRWEDGPKMDDICCIIVCFSFKKAVEVMAATVAVPRDNP